MPAKLENYNDLPYKKDAHLAYSKCDYKAKKTPV